MSKVERLVNCPAKVVETLSTLQNMGLPGWWSGLCVWVNCGKNTHSPRLNEETTAALLYAGYEWSAKKGAWYLRAADGIELAPMMNDCAVVYAVEGYPQQMTEEAAA